MSEIYVGYTRYCTHSERSEWGSWSESYAYNVNDTYAYLSKPAGYEYEWGAYVGGPNLEVGEKIYVIIASWSSGDSFGSSSGGAYSDLVMINRNKEIAEQNLKVLESISEKDLEYYRKYTDKRVLVRDDGSTQDIGYPGWFGYFECLTSLEIYELEVKA